MAVSMALDRIERVQHFDAPREELWKFFSDIEKLNSFTPDFFQLEILTKERPSLHEGQTIDYNLRLYGFKLPWRTEITSVDFPNSFTDCQARGPYKTFRHIHDFYELDDGVLMIDRVEFDIGWGLLGLIVQQVIVRPMLDRIFDHRREVCSKIFPIKENP